MFRHKWLRLKEVDDRVCRGGTSCFLCKATTTSMAIQNANPTNPTAIGTNTNWSKTHLHPILNCDSWKHRRVIACRPQQPGSTLPRQDTSKVKINCTTNVPKCFVRNWQLTACRRCRCYAMGSDGLLRRHWIRTVPGSSRTTRLSWPWRNSKRNNLSATRFALAFMNFGQMPRCRAKRAAIFDVVGLTPRCCADSCTCCTSGTLQRLPWCA